MKKFYYINTSLKNNDESFSFENLTKQLLKEITAEKNLFYDESQYDEVVKDYTEIMYDFENYIFSINKSKSNFLRCDVISYIVNKAIKKFTAERVFTALQIEFSIYLYTNFIDEEEYMYLSNCLNVAEDLVTIVEQDKIYEDIFEDEKLLEVC